MALAGGVDLVLLAHHRRDQAETFLLQALRGGGVAALSAMPVSARRDGVTWARPWLHQPGDAVAAYARRHRLRWVDDDSNTDDRFARNRLRTRVWPALLAAFPGAESSLASAASWAQQAAAVVEEVAASDLADVSGGGPLRIAAWRRLPMPRRRHALRAWLRDRLGAPAPGSLVERLLGELDGASVKRWPAPGGELHSYRGRLVCVPGAPARAAGEAIDIDLSRPGRLEVPAWGGVFQVERVVRGGIPVACAAALQLRERLPADRFQTGPGRPPRSLKLQFQAAGVPARERLGPVVCAGVAPVYVPGLGIDARAVGQPGEPQVTLTWHPE